MPALQTSCPAVPEAALRFWRALSPLQRRELLLLADRPHTPMEMEAALGVTQRVLMGRHGSLLRCMPNVSGEAFPLHVPCQ